MIVKNYLKLKGCAALILILLGMPFIYRVESVRSLSPSDIKLSSDVIPQGDVGLIEIAVKNGQTPEIVWMNQKLFPVPDRKRVTWYAFLGVDLNSKPGRYPLTITISPSGDIRKLLIEVKAEDYGVRRLTLPKKMVDLDSQTLKRVRKESKMMNEVWRTTPTDPIWIGAFERPIPGEIAGPFGRRSVINDQPRSPHSGVDLRGKRGTPVKAINRGKVALTGDFFFTGLTVIVDHGGGIQSMYFHLDRIQVQKAQIVEKSQVLGTLGSTGRATGPHLHWGIRINGARINPIRFMILSQRLNGFFS